jgi:RHS repeat-associated protein
MKNLLRRIGTIILLGQAGMAAAEVHYLHTDHLGSTAVVTNAAGAVQQAESYTPFGEILIPPNSPLKRGGFSPYLFTGKGLDREAELYYYEARYQDPVLSRFLSVDPLLEKEPERARSYLYVTNNPVRFVDPDGFAEEEVPPPQTHPKEPHFLEKLFHEIANPITSSLQGEPREEEPPSTTPTPVSPIVRPMQSYNHMTPFTALEFSEKLRNFTLLHYGPGGKTLNSENPLEVKITAIDGGSPVEISFVIVGSRLKPSLLDISTDSALWSVSSYRLKNAEVTGKGPNFTVFATMTLKGFSVPELLQALKSTFPEEYPRETTPPR